MQQVVKVSIGNMAFTLEKDAYGILSEYLSELNRHYAASAARAEITAEIESRIAELLIEKGYKDRIVTVDVVQVLINTLGRPEDIDGDGEPEVKKVRKRFFRDPDNKMVGGVCSGLGAYFSVDPVVFRIIFVAWVLIFGFFWMVEDENMFGFLLFGLLIYGVLWICMPMARTLEERYSMHGGSVSLRDIQEKVETGGRTSGRRVRSGSLLGRCLSIILGAFLFLIGMAGSITAVLTLLGIGVWNGFYPLGTSWLLSVFADVPVWASTLMTVFAGILVIVPFVAMLYAGTLLLFRLKSPKWRPGLIMFILWTVSLLGLIFVFMGHIGSLRSTDYRQDVQELAVSDTLYIEFVGCSQWKDDDVCIEADRDSYDMVYMGRRGRDKFLVMYPEISLRRTDAGSVAALRASTHWITSDMTLEAYKDMGQRRFWSFDGKTLRLEPVILSTDVRLSDIGREIFLNVDERTVVIVEEPVYHQFDSRVDFCTNRFLEMVVEGN